MKKFIYLLLMTATLTITGCDKAKEAASDMVEGAKDKAADAADAVKDAAAGEG